MIYLNNNYLLNYYYYFISCILPRLVSSCPKKCQTMHLKKFLELQLYSILLQESIVNLKKMRHVIQNFLPKQFLNTQLQHVVGDYNEILLICVYLQYRHFLFLYLVFLLLPRFTAVCLGPQLLLKSLSTSLYLMPLPYLAMR